ncbi:hypothetical protein ACP4OV_007795 [Aristida adscensionis]
MADLTPLLVLVLVLVLVGGPGEDDRRREVAGLGVRSADPCDGTWAGVQCDAAAGRVTSISASRAGLAGSLAGSDLSKLSSLAGLDLSFNSLAGDLPLLPTPLQHLRTLDLRGSAPTTSPRRQPHGGPGVPAGRAHLLPRPEFLGQQHQPPAGLPGLLRQHRRVPGPGEPVAGEERDQWAHKPRLREEEKIKYLDISGQEEKALGFRMLSGRIDEFIPCMESLVEVRLDHNYLFGPLPDVTSLVNLRVFHAADNHLCGVPKFAGGTAVDLSGNPGVGEACQAPAAV